MSQTDSSDTRAPGGETQRRRRTAVGRVVSNGADNQCRIGDTVTIAECRPVSRHKAWRVVEVLGSHEAD